MEISAWQGREKVREKGDPQGPSKEYVMIDVKYIEQGKSR